VWSQKRSPLEKLIVLLDVENESVVDQGARIGGAGKKKLYVKVIIPSAMYEFMEGLRQGWSFARRALMSG